ncbi:MAG: hypothetical protein ACRDOU_07030 [Streptosporangiaceae bacterium]
MATTIAAAALCPSPPLLCPPLTGRRPVLPELRAACAEVVGRLLGQDPDVVVVVGPGAATLPWDAGSRLDLSAFAPAIGEGGRGGVPLTPGTGGPPLALGLGAMLLDQAGYRGPRRLQAVGQDEPAGACAKLGADLAGSGARTGLLVMGDGSARRTLKAPGYLDPRAAGFDSGVERAIRAGDLAALLELDQALARDLMASGRPAWQVLAGAMPAPAPATEVLYCDDPFGVAYLVAYLRPRRAEAGAR